MAPRDRTRGGGGGAEGILELAVGTKDPSGAKRKGPCEKKQEYRLLEGCSTWRRQLLRRTTRGARIDDAAAWEGYWRTAGFRPAVVERSRPRQAWVGAAQHTARGWDNYDRGTNVGRAIKRKHFVVAL